MKTTEYPECPVCRHHLHKIVTYIGIINLYLSFDWIKFVRAFMGKLLLHIICYGVFTTGNVHIVNEWIRFNKMFRDISTKLVYVKSTLRRKINGSKLQQIFNDDRANNTLTGTCFPNDLLVPPPLFFHIHMLKCKNVAATSNRKLKQQVKIIVLYDPCNEFVSLLIS